MTQLTGVVLAAGSGTRLGELGRRFSKAMLPVAGRPLVEWILSSLRAAGLRRFVVVRHPSDEAIARWLRGAEDTVVVEQPERRGMADALRCALRLLEDEPAYVACACDSVFRIEDLRQLVSSGLGHPGSAVVGVLKAPAEATRTRSAVRLEGDRVVEIVEKPERPFSSLVAAPLYWLPREIRPCLAGVEPRGKEAYVTDVLREFLRSGGEVLAVPLGGRLEITTREDWVRAPELLKGLGYEGGRVS